MMRLVVPFSGWAPALAIGLIAGALAGCQDLPDVERLRCGNGIVEQQVDEDCDGVPAGSPYACGALGGVDACRFICAETECPPGWACGVDKLCRASTGTFERADIVQIGGETLELGDLDGDGALDLVSHDDGKIQLAFGTGDGRFDDLQTVRAPPPEAELIVADTNEDGLDDISFFSNNSLTILRGESSRLMVPAHVAEAEIGDESPQHVVSIATRTDDSHELLIMLGPQSEIITLAGRDIRDDAVIASLMSDGLVLAPIPARLDADDIDEIVLGRQRASTVVIFNIVCPDDADAACETVVRERLEMPDGAVLGPSPPLVGDLDGDGRADLLAVMDQPNGARVVGLALGSEAGFGPIEVRPELVAAAGCAPQCGEPVSHFSVAQRLADVVGDARADILTGTAIYEVAGDETLTLTERHAFPQPVILLDSVDVDNDGHLDVVGYGGGEITFLLSDGARFTLVTAANADGFPPAFGDYDGDGRVDLATWQSSGELVVAFSGTTGLPTEQAILGRFAPPVRLQATQRRRANARSLDRPDELAVVSSDGVSILYGDSARMPATFIGLFGGGTISTPPIVHLSIGRFEAGPPGVVAYLAMGPTFSAHSAAFDALSSAPFTTLPLDGCANQEPLMFRTQVVDVDADGLDEILQIETRRPRTTTPNVWNMQLARLEAGNWRCAWNVAVETNNEASGLLSTDVNGDGDPDVVALLTPSQAPSLRAGTEDAHLLLWLDPENDPQPTRHVVQPNASAVTLVDLGAEHTIMTFGDGRAWTATWNGSGFDPFDRFGVPLDVLDARTADVDGDGIDDVLIKTTTGVVVYRQTSCSAREAWLGTCTRSAPAVAP